MPHLQRQEFRGEVHQCRWGHRERLPQVSWRATQRQSWAQRGICCTALLSIHYCPSDVSTIMAVLCQRQCREHNRSIAAATRFRCAPRGALSTDHCQHPLLPLPSRTTHIIQQHTTVVPTKVWCRLQSMGTAAGGSDSVTRRRHGGGGGREGAEPRQLPALVSVLLRPFVSRILIPGLTASGCGACC